MRTLWAACFVALLLTPAVAAHGAPEVREIDLRVLADGTASGDYGGPEGIASEGAPDLLVLDMREARDAPGEPMVAFRFIHQLGDSSTGTIGLTITFDAGGAAHEYSMETIDGTSYTSSRFSRIDGPFDVGDGTPKAVEGWVPHSELGIQTGDQITNIRVTSTLDDTTADRMPGTYDVAGQTVPAVPPEDAVPGTYTVAGPAPLLSIEASVNTVRLDEPETVNISIGNPLESMEQFVTLAVTAPDGVTATLDSEGLALAANESRTVTLTIEGKGPGEIALTARTDLGGHQTTVFPLIGAAKTGDDSDVLSDDIANGGSFQHTFTTVGTFDYHCHPHPWMTAKVTIEEADNATDPEVHTIRIVEPDPADGQSWRFEPADLTIEAGDTVAWVNEGNEVHVIMGGVSGDGHHGSAAEGHGAPGHHGEETQSEDKGIPGFEAFLMLAALAIAFVARRR